MKCGSTERRIRKDTNRMHPLTYTDQDVWIWTYRCRRIDLDVPMSTYTLGRIDLNVQIKTCRFERTDYDAQITR